MMIHKPILLLSSGLMALSLAVSGCGNDPGDNPDAGPQQLAYYSIAGGSFAPLGDYTDIRGRAQILRGVDGQTTVELHIEGLEANTEYPAHVHKLPCDVDYGGGHYKMDPTVVETDENNEIWPAFTSGDNGVGRITLTVDHLARADAQAIVVHDPNSGNAKMACADLWQRDTGYVTRSGTLAPFAAAEAGDMTIGGQVEMRTDVDGTTLTMTVQGLDPAEQYTSHVHAYPCEVNDAGGHYKIDPTIEDTLEGNELWPVITPDAQGAASVELQNEYAARADAQAVVIHRVAVDGAPKVACANLSREYLESQTSGTAELLQAALDRGYDNLTATGSITRRLEKDTWAQIDVDGLEPEQQYPVHVHTYSCALDYDGGHYKIDPEVADTDEDNELWLTFTTDTGGGRISSIAVAGHLARPEAMSMVIHDYADGERLACIDLY